MNTFLQSEAAVENLIVPDSIQKEKIIAHLQAVKNGTRDLRF